ncbi:class I SAM-dependent methyltransferase [Cellulosimicrobium marinum]|uniref:class I SAM-dependent methyltransferase n=1 Tax=Cellulosimicrobium marinum TaxID=1638992 RepID=UPI001E61B938|nr:class I SAM-dependent methyltransferase [Cellulosimicrobium marinum]MCB7135016.1 class I SAM-dependent methyltransferase [Cellulosimicrobium marinum]
MTHHHGHHDPAHTEPSSVPGHEHAHGHGHGGAHPDDAACAEILDLDAVVFADLLHDVVARVAALAPAGTGTVVDLGAGTGTGTLALARAFPGAEVVALDVSATMLARLRGAVDAAGIGDRVRTVEADVDAGWPDVGPVDLVWASASMHHVADPARVLRDVRDALVPGGLAAVVEMTGTTPVLPPSVGSPGLVDRVGRAMAEAGWNRYPDWTPYLRDAGLELVERVEIEAAPTPGPDLDRWVRTTLERQHEHLADHLAPEDVDAIGAFLARAGHAASGTDGPPDATPIDAPTARSGRILWAARRPLR